MQLSHKFRLMTPAIAWVLLAFAAAASGKSQTPAMPLFDAPINATWAANHSEDWREKGFRGFLFEGLLDNFSLFPSEQEQERLRSNSASNLAAPFSNLAEGNVGGVAVEDEEYPHSDTLKQYTLKQIIPGDWDALVAEITGAVNRLKSSGLDRNFLRIQLAPEAPYFSDPFLLEVAENRLRLAGDFCRMTGLCGVAIDTQSQSAIHDYRWDGYAPGAAPEALGVGARRFGRRLLRAFIRAFPEGEILLLAHTPETAAPLWFAFLDGALESVGAATTIPIRLIVYDDGLPGNVAAYRERPKRLLNLFQETLSQSACRRWEQQGDIAFSLEPIYYEREMPTTRYPLDTYRNALYAAALYGNTYVVIAAPKGGWWHIPPDTAAQFGHLHQKGRARVTFAPPVPRPLDMYAPRLRIADASHIGAMTLNGTDVEILYNGNGAVLLAWDGLPDGLHIPTRTGTIVATNLETDERHYYTPRAGEIIVPARSELQLLEGFPMRPFALPAAMKMSLRTPIVAGITRAEMEIEMQNPLTMPLRGILTLGAETRYAVGASTAALNIAPGESITLRRTVQGISYLGHRPVFSMSLHIAADIPLTRSFSFPVEPPETVRLRMDGPISGAPVVLHQEGRKAPHIIAGDTRGGLLCLDTTSNNPLWRVRIRGRYAQPPLLINNAEGVPYVVTQNEHGRLRFYDMDGNEKVVVYPLGKTYTNMTAIAVPESIATCLATVSDGKIISIYNASGALRSRFERTDTIQYLASDDAAPGLIFIIASDIGEKDNDATEIASDLAVTVTEQAGTLKREQHTIARHCEAQNNLPYRHCEAQNNLPYRHCEARTNPPSGNFFLAAYNLNGVLLYEHTLPHTVSCAPIIHIFEDNCPLIVLGDSAGGIHCYDANDGAPLAFLPGEANVAATLMAVFDDPTDGVLLIAQANAASLALHTLQWNAENRKASVRWTLPLPHITALAVLPDNSGVVAGLASGCVYAVGADGRILWEECQGAGAVTGLTLYADSTRHDVYACIVASQAGMLRSLQIRKALIAGESIR